MSAFFTLLLSFLLLYKYIALFILVFASSVILFLPSNAIALVTGVFIGQGYFDFTISLAIGIAANTAGDFFDYFLARRFGNRVIDFFWRQGRPEIFNRVEKYINRYVGWTIIISRFTGSPGIVVNILCGLAPTRYRKFIAFDLLGNIINISLLYTIGYFIGSYWEKASDTINTINLILTLAFTAYLIYLVRRKK